MFDDFGLEVSLLLKNAYNECVSLKCQYVGSEHILLSLLKTNEIIKNIFINYGVDYDNFKEKLLKFYKSNKENVFCDYSILLKNILFDNLNSMTEFNSIDFLIHIIDSDSGIANRILETYDIDLERLLGELKTKTKCDSISKYGLVLNKTVDMNEKVINREEELLSVIRTLIRKKKNNPLLIGDAGVGKTAIVEELARRINLGHVPDLLKDKKILKIDMASLLSGARYRGDFEEKITNLINDLLVYNNYILFIDEAHTIMNAGGSEGAISASDILKPYLARGEIKCIGATTIDEYEKFIVKDSAFDRRFDKVFINEITNDKLFNVLLSAKDEYEKFYDITISEENIKDLLDLSNLLKTKKCNPDKSVELLDSVCSFVKLKNAGNHSLEEIALKEHDYKTAIKYKRTLIKSSKLQDIITKDDIKKVVEIKNNDISREKFNDLVIQLRDKINNKIFLENFSKLLDKNKSRYLVYNCNNQSNFDTLIKKCLTNFYNVLDIDLLEYSDKSDYFKVVGDNYESNYILKKLDNNLCKVVIIRHFDSGLNKLKTFFYNMIKNGYYYDSKGIEKNCNDVLFLVSGFFPKKNIGFNSITNNTFFDFDEIINID